MRQAMMKQVLAGGAICAAAVFGMGSPALAGEIKGNGAPITIHSNSECAFSGLQDDPFSPGSVQNWGHTKDSPVVVSAPRGASDVTVDFGGGAFQLGCNASLHPLK